MESAAWARGIAENLWGRPQRPAAAYGHDHPAVAPYYYYQANPAKMQVLAGFVQKMFNNGLKTD